MRGRVMGAVAVCLLSGGVWAQQVVDLAVDGVLKQLQAHLEEYRGTVPDIFCSEHVVSSVETRRTHTQTMTDSTFRLRKTKHDDGLVTFEESRAVLAVDGKVPIDSNVEISGPAILSGVFSDGLHMVAHEVEGCYDYTLETPRPGHPKDRMVVKFKDAARDVRPYGCPPYEGTWGQTTIDPVSMRVLRLEKTMPDPQRVMDQTAIWKWTVEYAPVVLDGKSFWMPKTIRSTSRTEGGDYVWSFEGSYKSYHLFHATTRIVPVGP